MTGAEQGRIIAFTGTNGTGKTTPAYREATRLCIAQPGKRIGIILETAAAKCPYPINLDAT